MEEIIIPIDELPINGLPEYRLGYKASKVIDEYNQSWQENEIFTDDVYRIYGIYLFCK